MNIKEWAGTAGAIVSSATATLTLVGYISSLYVKYLDEHFATKNDLAAAVETLHRIEEKINGWSYDKNPGQLEPQSRFPDVEARNQEHDRRGANRPNRHSTR
jgi:hypothetical protein